MTASRAKRRWFKLGPRVLSLSSEYASPLRSLDARYQSVVELALPH